MGRSQYLLNRSKQRFKKIHGRLPRGSDDHESSTEEAPPSPAKQGYQPYQPQYHEESYHRNNQHQLSSLQRQGERRFQQQHQHSAHEDDFSSRQTSEAGDGTNDQTPELSWSFSEQTRDEQQSLHQRLERQKYEYEQQQLQMRQEQLRQQEQLRWQQHQLQLQQEQLRQQEQVRQVRQQQQIRNQKLHHQQRHQYQLQQKQLRDQQQLLEQQYHQQQREQQQQGAKRQTAETRRHQPKEQKVLERETKTQQAAKEGEGKSSSKLRKGWWRRQIQLLKQLDDEESLYDLHKAISRPRAPPIGFVSSGVSVSSNQPNSAGDATEGQRGVQIDVRAVSEALTFLDRASRLQIPEHLAATLNPFTPTPRRDNREQSAAVISAIGVRQGKNHGLYGNDSAQLQQSYSLQSMNSAAQLSASYSRHQQNAAALSSGLNNMTGYQQQRYNSYQQNAMPSFQQSQLPGLQQMDHLPSYQQALPAYPRRVVPSHSKEQPDTAMSSSLDYDLSGSFIQMPSHTQPSSKGTRSKTSALSVSSSSSRSLEPKSTNSNSYDGSSSFVGSAYSVASVKETPSKQIKHVKSMDAPPARRSPNPALDPPRKEMPSQIVTPGGDQSMNGLPPVHEEKTGSIQDSYTTPVVAPGKTMPGVSIHNHSYRTPEVSSRRDYGLPDVATPLHKNARTLRRDPEPVFSNLDLPGPSANSDMASPRYFGANDDNEASTFQLEEVASPSTIGVSVLSDGPTTEENLSFPSLKITEAFTMPTGKDKEKDNQSSTAPSPAASPSPSDVLMTYTVTDGGDDSIAESAAKSNSNPSRRSSSGRSSTQSRKSASMRDRQTPPLSEKIRQKMDTKESWLPPKNEPYESRRVQEEDLPKSPSSQDQGNEPPYLPPSSSRSLVDQRSTGDSSRARDTEGKTTHNDNFRSNDVQKKPPSNENFRPPPSGGRPREGAHAHSHDGDIRLSSPGGRPQSSIGRDGHHSSGRREKERLDDDSDRRSAAEMIRDFRLDQPRPRSRPRDMTRSGGFDDDQQKSSSEVRPGDIPRNPQFDDSHRDSRSDHGVGSKFSERHDAEPNPLHEPTRSHETSKNSRSTHASFYEPIHPYETTRNDRPTRGQFVEPMRHYEPARSLQDQFVEPMTPHVGSRRREESGRFGGRGISPIRTNSRQVSSNDYYEDPSSTRAVAISKGKLVHQGGFDEFEEPLGFDHEGLGASEERQDESIDPDESTFSSRRTTGQYRQSGHKQYTHAYDLDAPFTESFDESTTNLSELTTGRRGHFSKNSQIGHRRSMADYEDASNSVPSRGEDDSIFSSGRSMVTTDRSTLGVPEPSYIFEKASANDAFFMDVNTLGGHHHPIRKDNTQKPMKVSTLRSAYAKMTKALTKERYTPIGIPGKKQGLLRQGPSATNSRLIPSFPQRQGKSKEDEEDLDTWLENAMASKSIDEGCVLDARQFVSQGDEADLDAWLDNVICR